MGCDERVEIDDAMQHNTMVKPNQTYRFHFLGQFHRIHRVLEQKKEDTTQKTVDAVSIHVPPGWFGYGDSIGIATGDFHLMYIDENQQKRKRKESYP